MDWIGISQTNIQAVLEDAAEQQVQNHQDKQWLMKLKDITTKKKNSLQSIYFLKF